MSYLDSPADQGETARLYETARDRYGYVPNFTQVFALAPDVYDAWARLNVAIKSGMDLRRYELVTLAAARRLRSTYCSLAHGSALRDRFYDAPTVRQIAADHRHAGLDETDVAVMDFAERVVADATAVTAGDIAALRDRGLSDVDILHVALAAAARCFFSKTLDAVGAEPDREYRTSVEPELREALTVGRPVEA